jgi:ubiquinone biosynthesis protein COQ9
MSAEERDMKDALLKAMLPHVPFDGWTRKAMRDAAVSAGLDEAAALSLFPGGPRDLVAWFSHWADRETLIALEPLHLDTMKVRERIGTAVRTRLAVLEPHREAVRRALALLAVPLNAPLGAKLLYDTVDALWYAAGDTATDFNFYTKRGLLAGVYGATTLYWLDDRSPGSVDTLAFLDRRLADVMRIPKATRHLKEWAARWPNPFLLFRPARRR